MRRWPVLALTLALGCLFPDLSSLTTTDAGITGTGADASAPPYIASAGHVSTATGAAQQTHVFWAVSSKRWWLFTIDDDATHLKTRSSPDFVTWTDGASLALAHPTGGEGRNFTVAYANIATSDVVHVSFSHAISDAGPCVHSHTRGMINGSSITFDAPADVSQVSSAPLGVDGPAAIVSSNGTVWDSTGFVVSQGAGDAGYGNQDVFRSTSSDNGVSWSGGFSRTTLEIVQTATTARAFLDADGLSAIWTRGDALPDPTNLRFSSYGATWAAPFSIFDTSSAQDPNDWSVAPWVNGTTTEGHIVRARVDGTYEHAYGSGGNGQNGAAPPSQSRIAGTGLVLLSDPTHLAVFDVASNGALVTSRWNGSAWSAWSVIAAPAPRAFLSGYCPDLGAHPEAGGCALVWTAPSNGYVVEGMLVTTH